MPSEYVGELKKWAAELVRKNTAGDFVGFNRAVDLVSKNFALQPHEVAIFAMTPDERFLYFVVPEKLKEVGRIPLTSTNSLAARTVREKRPEIINHFSVVPHSSVFEAVPLVERMLDIAKRQNGSDRGGRSRGHIPGISVAQSRAPTGLFYRSLP